MAVFTQSTNQLMMSERQLDNTPCSNDLVMWMGARLPLPVSLRLLFKIQIYCWRTQGEPIIALFNQSGGVGKTI